MPGPAPLRSIHHDFVDARRVVIFVRMLHTSTVPMTVHEPQTCCWRLLSPSGSRLPDDIFLLLVIAKVGLGVRGILGVLDGVPRGDMSSWSLSAFFLVDRRFLRLRWDAHTNSRIVIFFHFRIICWRI